MEGAPAFTLAEIKKALTKHNTDMNNDVRVRVTKDGLKFSSAKAEEVAIQTEGEKTALKKEALSNLLARDTYQPPQPKPKAPKKKMAAAEKPPAALERFLTKK